MKMGMQQMVERLLVGQEQMMADRKADQGIYCGLQPSREGYQTFHVCHDYLSLELKLDGAQFTKSSN
jgi:hypothetical protein